MYVLAKQAYGVCTQLSMAQKIYNNIKKTITNENI